MSLPVAILAGGKATRLYPMTATIPKSLIDVAGKPFIEHQVDLLCRNNIKHIVICAGFLGDKIKQVVGDGTRFGVRIQYVFDGQTPLGTGGALKLALPALGEAFLVLYGDSFLEIDYGAVEAAFLLSEKLGLMTVYENSGRFDSSNVLFADGRIIEYDKVNRLPEMRHIDYGMGAFHRSVFDDLSANEFYDLVHVYKTLIQRGELAGFEVQQRFYEIGSPDGLAETRAYLGRGMGK